MGLPLRKGVGVINAPHMKKQILYVSNNNQLNTFNIYTYILYIPHLFDRSDKLNFRNLKIIYIINRIKKNLIFFIFMRRIII